MWRLIESVTDATVRVSGSTRATWFPLARSRSYSLGEESNLFALTARAWRHSDSARSVSGGHRHESTSDSGGGGRLTGLKRKTPSTYAAARAGKSPGDVGSNSGGDASRRIWKGVRAAQAQHAHQPPDHVEQKEWYARFRDLVSELHSHKNNQTRTRGIEIEAADHASVAGPRIIVPVDTPYMLAWTMQTGLLAEVISGTGGFHKGKDLRLDRRVSRVVLGMLKNMSEEDQLDAVTLISPCAAPGLPPKTAIATTQFLGGLAGSSPFHTAFANSERETAKIVGRYAKKLMSPADFRTYLAATNAVGENLLHSRWTLASLAFIEKFLGKSDEAATTLRDMITARSLTAGSPLQHQLIELVGDTVNGSARDHVIVKFVEWVGTLGLDSAERFELVARPSTLMQGRLHGVQGVLHQSGGTLFQDQMPNRYPRSRQRYSTFDVALLPHTSNANVFSAVCALLDDDALQCEAGWAMLERPNNLGWTPLHSAAAAGHDVLATYVDLLARSKMPIERLAALLVATTSSGAPIFANASASSTARSFAKPLQQSALQFAARHTDHSFELILDIIHAATPSWFALLLRGGSSTFAEDEYWGLLAGADAGSSVCADLLRAGNANGLKRWRAAVDAVDFPIAPLLRGQKTPLAGDAGDAGQGFDDLLLAAVEGGSGECTAAYLGWLCDFFEDADHCAMLLSSKIARGDINIVLLAARNPEVFTMVMQYCDTILNRTQLYSPLWNLCTAIGTDGANPVAELLSAGCSPDAFSTYFTFLRKAACGVWDDQTGLAAPPVLDVLSHSTNFADGLSHSSEKTVTRYVAAVLSVAPGASSPMARMLFNAGQYHPVAAAAASRDPEVFDAILATYSAWVEAASEEEKMTATPQQRPDLTPQCRPLKSMGSRSFFGSTRGDAESVEQVYNQLSEKSLVQLLCDFATSPGVSSIATVHDVAESLVSLSVWTRVISNASADGVREYLELCMRVSSAAERSERFVGDTVRMRVLKQDALMRAVKRGDLDVIATVFEYFPPPPEPKDGPLSGPRGPLFRLLASAVKSNSKDVVALLLDLYEAAGRSDDIHRVLITGSPGPYPASILHYCARSGDKDKEVDFKGCAAPIIDRLHLLSEDELEYSLTRLKSGGYTFLHLACLHSRAKSGTADVIDLLDKLFELSPRVLRVALHEPNAHGFVAGFGGILNDEASAYFEMMRERTAPTKHTAKPVNQPDLVSDKPVWYIE